MSTFEYTSLLMMIIIFCSCAPIFSGKSKDETSASHAIRLINSEGDKLIILDVRPSEKFGEGHIPGSRNIDYFSSDLEKNLLSLPTDQTIIVYCEHGLRSKNVVSILKRMGHKKVFSLKGGIEGWKSKGYKVETE